MHVLCLQEHGWTGASYALHAMSARAEKMRRATPRANAVNLYDRLSCGVFQLWPCCLELLLALHKLRRLYRGAATAAAKATGLGGREG